jgi:hypothetical protein
MCPRKRGLGCVPAPVRRRRESRIDARLRLRGRLFILQTAHDPIEATRKAGDAVIAAINQALKRSSEAGTMPLHESTGPMIRSPDRPIRIESAVGSACKPRPFKRAIRVQPDSNRRPTA